MYNRGDIVTLTRFSPDDNISERSKFKLGEQYTVLGYERNFNTGTRTGICDILRLQEMPHWYFPVSCFIGDFKDMERDANIILDKIVLLSKRKDIRESKLFKEVSKGSGVDKTTKP